MSETSQETIERVANELHGLAAYAGGLADDLDELLLLPPAITKLSAPYMSQWGPTANKRRGDCGPATVAMAVHFLTSYRPTVDEAATACKQPATGRGSFFTSIYQLHDGLAFWGLKGDIASPYSSPKLTLALLRDMIDKGKPSIALVDYKVLREETNGIPGIVHNQDQGYNFGHFVLFVGYSTKGVYVHDSDYWGDRVDEGAFRWVPLGPFEKALQSPALGNTYGSSGIIIP